MQLCALWQITYEGCLQRAHAFPILITPSVDFRIPPTFPSTYGRTPGAFLHGFHVKPQESSRLVYDWERSTPGNEHTVLFNQAGSVPLPPQDEYSQVVPIVMQAWISVIKDHSNLSVAFNHSNNSFDYERDDDVIIARARKVDQLHCSSQGFMLPDKVVKALNLAPEMTIVCPRESGNWFMESMEFKL